MATTDSLPEVAAIVPGSCADRAGLRVGDIVEAVNNVSPRDIIEWYSLVDGETARLRIRRNGASLHLEARRLPGESFGAEVSSAVFDRVRTCDNHCEFCFIYQLPKGMRRSLYLKDDDYRLSFLYGNFTTLTRFTEADFERVISERLSPLYVSIHTTSPDKRAEMLRNPRGGFSLRWAQELARHRIDIRGQIVLCPGVNDGDHLNRTILDAIDQFPFLSSLAVVPLGLSKHNTEQRMRVHTKEEAAETVDIIRHLQRVAMRLLGRRFVFLADELYLRAGSALPSAEEYEGFQMLEDGIGLARAFIDGFEGDRGKSPTTSDCREQESRSLDREVRAASPTAYVRNPAADTGLRVFRETPVRIRSTEQVHDRICIITGECAEPVLRQTLSGYAADKVSIVGIENRYFGGNTSVAGLLTGMDIADFLRTQHRADTLYLLPDVCLNGELFLDGIELSALRDLAAIEVVTSSGAALRQVVEDFIVKGRFNGR